MTMDKDMDDELFIAGNWTSVSDLRQARVLDGLLALFQESRDMLPFSRVDKGVDEEVTLANIREHLRPIDKVSKAALLDQWQRPNVDECTYLQFATERDHAVTLSFRMKEAERKIQRAPHIGGWFYDYSTVSLWMEASWFGDPNSEQCRERTRWLVGFCTRLTQLVSALDGGLHITQDRVNLMYAMVPQGFIKLGRARLETRSEPMKNWCPECPIGPLS